MLKQILAEFRQANQPLCPDTLSRKLAIEPGALEGMLRTLVQAGRLLEIDPADNTCVNCRTKGSCHILTNGLQKSYMLKTDHQTIRFLD